MKIERIDDNSIRCTLTSLDLSSRNINLRDMTYGSAAAKRLFNEMMQKAKDEVGFVPDNTPLMIEAVPLQGGSIQLIISKVDDPEELDTRFSKFSQSAMSRQNGWLSQLASEILEGAQDILGKNGDVQSKADTEDQAQAADAPAVDLLRIFRFTDLDRVSDAAAAIGSLYNGENTLYKDESNHRYYLVLHTGKGGAEALQRASNLLSEYGDKVNGGELNEAYYEEHLEKLIGSDALQKLAAL